MMKEYPWHDSLPKVHGEIRPCLPSGWAHHFEVMFILLFSLNSPPPLLLHQDSTNTSPDSRWRTTAGTCGSQSSGRRTLTAGSSARPRERTPAVNAQVRGANEGNVGSLHLNLLHCLLISCSSGRD